MEKGDCRAEHRSRFERTERELSATRMFKTCRHNEGDKPTIRSEYIAVILESKLAGSLVETESSQSKRFSSDQLGHGHNPKDGIDQQKHWKISFKKSKLKSAGSCSFAIVES